MSKVYGYVRVSTKEQNEDRQVNAMQQVGIAKKDMYMDKQSGKDLMGTLIADLVLTLLSYVSENERSNIKNRQKEGIEAAKKRGVKFGRPSQPLPKNFEEVYQKWVTKEISAEEAAKRCGFTKSTFYNRARKRKSIEE